MSRHLAAARGQRVLLLNPPAAEIPAAQDRWHSADAPPFALLRLASWLRGLGAEVELLDALADPALQGRPQGRVRQRLRCGDDGQAPQARDVHHYGLDGALLERRLAERAAPDLIAVSATFTWHAEVVREVVAACRRVHPGAKVVLGGHYPTLCPEAATACGADELVQGEVEAAAFAPTALDLVQGTLREDWLRLVKGCPHRCSYCVTPALNDGRVRTRDPEAVLAEMKAKAASHGVRTFVFNDDAILYRRAHHVEPLLELVAQERLDVSLDFATGLVAHQVDERLARLMAEGRVSRAILALETLDEDVARRMNRPQRLDQFERAVAILRDHGFTGERLKAFYLTGLPGQTTDQILQAVTWLYRLGVTPHLTAYTLTPGSEDHLRHRSLVEGLPLEALAPCLWRFASPAMTVDELDTCFRYFHDRSYPVERILGSPTEDPLIRRLQALAAR